MTARRVLVVDDDDLVRDVAQLSMGAVGGHDVVGASSGAEGVERAQAESFDAILLDVMMPGLDGPATLERLREHPSTREVAVVFLTAKVQTNEQTVLSSLPGVRGVLTKPFDPMTLPTQVAQLLGW